jgi:hypothetical protein
MRQSEPAAQTLANHYTANAEVETEFLVRFPKGSARTQRTRGQPARRWPRVRTPQDPGH